MRPSRGRPPVVGGQMRAKPCFVRLGKVSSARDDKDDEDENKKMTGPLKKRPVVIKKSPPGRQRKIEIEEDLSDYNLVTARSRRTPKPNPKYNNEHILSKVFRSQPKTESMGEDTDEEVVEEEEVDISSDEVEHLTDEGDDDSSEDDKRRGRRPGVRGMKASISPSVKRGPGRGRIRYTPVHRKLSTPDLERKNFEQLRKRQKNEDDDFDETSIIARNKRLNIELYDASDSDVPTISPVTVVRSRGRPPKSLASTSKSETVVRRINQTTITKKSRRQETEEEDDDSIKQISDDDDLEGAATTGAASTMDDFETMPTFTIVNINDIINKKGDVLISQKSPEEDISQGSQQSRNRRKSMHTTILSDKIDQSKLIPPPRSPFPPRKPTSSMNTLNNNNLSKSLLSSSSGNDNFKTAPRILNSVIGKKTRPVTPLVSKVPVAKDRVSEASNFSPPLGKSKENLHTNAFGHSPTSRKLPAEKVLVQRQGNKVIKKITCFETWYVINIPTNDPPVLKNYFEMSMTELGNRTTDICLPSDIWSYKVTLQKLSEAQISKGNYEEFTGDVSDTNIPENEKHKYQPVNIMFRRKSQTGRLRMPYDRAVIFKNKTFFVNIDGKNVRLLAAPQTVQSVSDVEVLLEIVDEMEINSQFVEQSTFIL